MTLAPPARPTSGELFTPIVIEIAGSSTVISGSGRGCIHVGQGLADHDVRDAGDGHDVPGPADSADTRSSASVRYSSEILTRSIEPSRRHQAAC